MSFRSFFYTAKSAAGRSKGPDGPFSPAWLAAEVGGANQVRPQKLRRRTARDQAAALEDVSVVGDRERLGDVLLDQEDGHVLVADAPDERHHLIDEPRRQPERRLVQHEHARPPDQRAGERDHLLLAAAHRAGELAPALAEAGKQRERPLEARGTLGPREEPAAELQVLEHGHPREQVPSLGDEDEAGADRRGGRARRQRAAVERRATAAREEARQRPEQGTLAGAVRADDRGDPSRGKVEVEPVENAKAAVPGGKPGDLQRRAHGRAPAAPSPR